MREESTTGPARRRLGRLMSLTTLATVVLSTAAAVPSSGAQAAGDAPLARADLASALASARQTGQRVRISDATTSNAEFFATSDGRVEGEIAAGIVRFRRDGSWVPVDLTLARQPDGSVAPKAHPDSLRLSGERKEGSGFLATVGTGADQLAMGWNGALPAPQLAGNRATYPEAMPGVDLIVDATATGFEQYVVVKSPAAAARVRDLSIPLTGSHVASIDKDERGHLRVRDKHGTPLAAIPAPVMWDADGPANRPVAARATELKIIAAPAPAVAGRATRSLAAASSTTVSVRMSPDQGWLTDPATTYPVTLDPQIDRLLTPGSTTVVQGYETGWNDADSIFLGALSSTQAARALVDWDTTQLRGMEITEATAYFFNSYAHVCAPAPWEIWTTNPAAEGVGWDDQPRWLYKEASSTQTSCSGDWVSIDAKSFFQRAAMDRAERAHMGIRAGDETDVNQWKQFSSRNNADASHVPYARVVYAPVPPAEAEWTQEPDVPATDGSNVAEINPDEEAAQSLIEDPEAADSGGVGIRYALGTRTPLATEESYEELQADPQLQDVEEGDESADDSTGQVRAATADAPGEETCSAITKDQYSCLRPGTAAGIQRSDAENPGASMRALDAMRDGAPIEDGTRGDLTVEPMHTMAGSGIPKPKQMPDICYDRARAYNFSWLRTRYSACRSRTWDQDFYMLRNGTRTWLGQASWWEYNYLYTKRNSRTWVSQVSISVYARRGDTLGLKIGLAGRGAKCSTNCTVKWRLPASALSVANKVDGVATIKSNVARGKSSTMTATWAYRMSLGDVDASPSIIDASERVRCDQQLKGYPTSVGCVVPSVVPTFTYSRTGNFRELARHIYDAQNSQLPGKYPSGTPLTRLTSDRSIAANRRASCPSSLTRPSGKTCDEYPFASSYQGGSTGGGSARTFSWCAISGTPTNVTGSRGFSRCMINGEQNSKGGRALQTFYSQNRILKSDKYRVRIS
ncbi:deoxyribonuclease NucA/NucB [Krasilnikovia cinnamomea]|uniref:Deoxyribonuclease NucA/NucB n=1 Tax=Krasilnikovia cinnamomea TaxID=349313 RepID=A0A4Q7ZLN5_9ACTN|nr:DNRLRE domain-containing protein [Krasilnikovia cinnamomea]RZU51293.1 deoxyribonuclease NucA/NucB [Krasilnikovia cinnamomea]